MTVRTPASFLLALALTALPTVPARAVASDPLDGYRVVPGIGLAREVPGGYELFSDRGTGLIVHGHDTTSMIPALSAAERSAASYTASDPACVTGGNYYTQVIYAHPPDRPSRYASMAPHIRDLVRDNTGRLVEEAGEFGQSRKYRVLCNASNQITVSDVATTVTSATDFNALVLDLENKGFNAAGVKYWVWFEGTTGPGVLGTGHVYDDSSPSSANPNNGNGQAMFAVLWGDEAGVPQYEATTWMHENGHNMGAVVSDAPNTSGNRHCIDDQDIMCYVDGGVQAACCFQNNACVDREHFDCNHNDYFHPAPTSGFLTNHWNIGSAVNRFLDATAGMQLRFAVSSISVNEDSGSVTLTVDRVGSTAGTVGVTASTSPGSAQAGSDYTTTAQTLSFGPGITQRTVTVPIISDGSTGENTESFTVGLSAATGGAAIGSPSTVTVSISESSSPPTIQFSSPTGNVNEGAASASFTVTRTGATGAPVEVSYATTAGSATPGSDYTDVSGTLSFGSGEVAKTVTVPLLDDQRFEPDETFSATLSSPTNGAVLGPTTTTTTTIVETDARPTLALTSNATQVEETAGALPITVTRTGATDDAVSVTLSTSPDTATSADFTPVSATLVFDPGVITRQVSIPIVNDAAAEGTETFTVSLGAPTGLGQLGSPASTMVAIVDDDGGIVQTQASSLAASETTPVTLTAVRTITQAAGSVGWSLHQTQPFGATRTGTLPFAAGAATASVTLNLDDNLSTGDRSFTFALSNPNGMSLGARTTTSLRLTDDETPPQIGFAVSDVRLEENVGAQPVTIIRTGNTNGSGSVTLGVTAGSATLLNDVTVPTGTVSFAPGETTRTISLTVHDDVFAERDETLSLTLGQASGATLGASSATITIGPSDQQPDVIVYGTSPSPAGNNQYASSPSSQSATVVAPRVGGPAPASFVVENDGNATNTFTLIATTPPDATELRYRIDGVDVTTAISSASGFAVRIDPLARVTVQVQHSPATTTLPGTRRDVALRVRWTGDGVREDSGTLSFVAL